MNFSIAFIGGLLTFLSPCVLPLLPVYLSYMAGTSTSDSDQSQRHTLINALSFSFGFTIAFVLIGVAFYGVVAQLRVGPLFSQVLGGVLIILGLHTLGVYKIPFLMRDSRKMGSNVNALSIGSSCMMGVFFAAGWSPCIGPILASILALGSATGSVHSAALMMLVFSLGLAIPFILSALLSSKASGWARKNARHTVWFERITGLLILAIGILLLFVSIHDLSGWLQEHAPWADHLLEIEESLLGDE